MKQLNVWLRRCHFPLMLLLSVYPPVLLFLCLPPETPGSVFLLPVACALLTMLCLAVPSRRRTLCAVLSAAALVALSALLLPLRVQHGLILLPVVSVILLFASFSFASRSLNAISPVFFAVGVGAHLFTQWFLRSEIVGGVRHTHLFAPMAVATLLYLPLLLLTLNRISLNNASLGRHGIPAPMRRFNTLLTGLFLLLSLAIAAVPAVARGFMFLWGVLRTALLRVCAFLLSLLPQDSSAGGLGAGGGMGFGPPAMEAAEPSLIAVILEWIASALTAVIVIVGTFILIRKVLRLLRILLRRLLARLQRYVTAISEDYEDEITDTREGDVERESRWLWPVRRRTAAAAPPTTPQEHIRFRYARLLRRHREWAASSTARENLHSGAAALYEQARYSDHPLTQDDVRQFTDHTKDL